MPTFRIRQEARYYLETVVEADDEAALKAFVEDFDLEETLEGIEPDGPWATFEPELLPTDKEPEWKLEGDKLVRIKKVV